MIAEKCSNKELAIILGISKSAFQRKLKRETEFSQPEIKKIIDVFNLTNQEIRDIFFDKEVS